MRDYIYIWHDPKNRFVVASGIQLKDVAAAMSVNGGLILLVHDFADAFWDPSSRFDFVPNFRIEALQAEDAYRWGDVCWVDYDHKSFPTISKKDISDLLYFRHTGEPYQEIRMPSVGNRFLATGHDDGWYLKIYYTEWPDIVDILGDLPLLASKEAQSTILTGKSGAFWVDESGITEEEPTLNIDSLLNRRATKTNVEQGGGGNALEPPSHPSTASSKSRATP
jgi:hypothetical protein